jgi:hypothetical protein
LWIVATERSWIINIKVFIASIIHLWIYILFEKDRHVLRVPKRIGGYYQNYHHGKQIVFPLAFPSGVEQLRGLAARQKSSWDD